MLSWLLIADLLVATGALHALVALTSPPTRMHSLERQLFALDQTKFDAVIVGDPIFIEKARARLAERAGGILFLQIPGFHLPDAETVAKAIRKTIGFERLVLQASPHFWSDLWMRQPALDINLWQGYGRSRWPQLKRARLVFDALAKRVAAPGADDRDRWPRPATLRGISWVETPKQTRRLMTTLGKLKPEGLGAVYWVPDRDGLAEDIEPDLQDNFNRRFDKGGFDETFGHVLERFSELPR
jgi:hypothetical protein